MNYTVRSGDTVGKIASAFGVTVAAIVAANRLANANVIRVGQVLTIPAAGVTVNAAGQIVSPALTDPNASWFDKFLAAAPALANAGVSEAIRLKDASANRKLAIANGQPITSPIDGRDVVDVQTQEEANAQTSRWVVIGFCGLLVATLFSAAKSANS